MLGTAHEISEVVESERSAAASVETPSVPEVLNVEENDGAAEAVFVEEVPVGAETMKKSFMRKKEREIPSEDGKRQKPKVVSTRK